MSDDERAIRKLVERWLSASKEGDTATVVRLMADDVVFLTTGRPPMRGKAAFAAAQSALQNVDIDAKSTIEEIRIFGDWAYLWTTLSVTMTPRGGAQPLKRSGNTLSVLRKQAGEWVIVRDANMLAVLQ